MAKSADTFITLNNFKKQGIAPLAYRYFCLNTHYRQQLQYGISALQSAQKTLTNLKNFLMGIKSDNYSGCEKYEHMFLEAVNDDLNIPRGLGIMWQMIDDDNFSSPEKKNSILKFDEILGLNLHQSPKIPKSVIKLGEQRQKARRNKDWGKADSLRAEIEKMGYKIEDVGDNFVIKLL